MNECKAAKYNPANACQPGQPCKWPGACQSKSAPAPAPEEVLPSASDTPVNTEAATPAPKRSRKASS